MAAGAEILIEQAVVLVDFGALGWIELAAVGRTFDERGNALAVEAVKFAAY